jgi:hypothetical protein
MMQPSAPPCCHDNVCTVVRRQLRAKAAHHAPPSLMSATSHTSIRPGNSIDNANHRDSPCNAHMCPKHWPQRFPTTRIDMFPIYPVQFCRWAQTSRKPRRNPTPARHCVSCTYPMLLPEACGAPTSKEFYANQEALTWLQATASAHNTTFDTPEATRLSIDMMHSPVSCLHSSIGQQVRHYQRCAALPATLFGAE